MNYLEPNTLVDLIEYRAIHQPNDTAYVFLVDGETEEIRLTYKELQQKSQALATHLQSSCLPKERALLIYPPGLEYIIAFFACLYAGIIAIPAYPPRPNRSLLRLEGILADGQPKIALTIKSVLFSLERRLSDSIPLQNLQWLPTDSINDNLATKWQAPELNSHSLAFLQYTSGSTAAPKGVMISHGNLIHNSQSIYKSFGHTKDSQGVIWLPPYHDMGLIGGIIQPLYGGFTGIIMSPLMFLQSPIRWLQAISRYRGTSSGGPNFAYELCWRKIKPEQIKTLDLSCWEVAFNGAEPINYKTLEHFAHTFAPCGFRREAFYPCYGMAEATLMVSGGGKKSSVFTKIVNKKALEQNQVIPAKVQDHNTYTLVGCGHSFPDQKILIVNPETLIECPSGEVGEIWLSGPSIAHGYWNQPEATKYSFGAYLKNTQLGPFLRTGDLGFLENGELFVTGRLKDVIIINGCNYYPQDIEWTLEHKHSEIKPSCIAGFSIDVDGEERLVIVAELERGYYKDYLSSNNSLDINKLVSSIRRTVSQYHDLQVYSALLVKPGTIPRTSSGKVQRHACRVGFLAGTLEVISECVAYQMLETCK